MAKSKSAKGFLSQGKGVYLAYNNTSSEYPPRSAFIFLNNLSNTNNAYDNGLNQWDNGNLGNNYSDFNDPKEGCLGGKTCKKEYRIDGGFSVDRYPLAAIYRITSREPELRIENSDILPGEEMEVSFTAPKVFEAWPSLEKENSSWGEQYLGQNKSGQLSFTAHREEGLYNLQMYDKDRKVLLSIPFNVTKPRFSYMPIVVGKCP